MKFHFDITGWAARTLVMVICDLALAVTVPAQTHYAYAQPSATQTPTAQAKASSTVTEWRDALGRSPSTQLTEKQTTVNGNKVQTSSWETQSGAGTYQPGADTEEETQQVDARTVRVIQRRFATDANGNRKVIGIMEEEKRTLPGGKETSTRTASQPDLNGGFRIVRRDIEESATTSSGARESHTTVLMPGVEQSLVPHEQTVRIERKQGGVETAHTTHLLPDLNGSWQVNKVEDKVVKAQSKDTRTVEERVYQRDAQQNLSVSKEVITNAWKDASGQEHELVEAHSAYTPGTTVPGDGTLTLDRRLRLLRRTAPDGTQTVDRQEERRDQNAPFNGMKPAQRILETSASGPEGVRKEGTVEAFDGNGGSHVVWVFTTRPE